MNHLAKIVRGASPCPSVIFRKESYGSAGIRSFLRDVISLANASVEGPRYIIVGVELDDQDRRTFVDVPDSDFQGKPSYKGLVAEHVEPPVRLRYQPVTVEGKQIGIFEIGECQDRPYMMRIDFSETLRRGDAYARIQRSPIKLGRAQLQSLFEKKFRESVSGDRIEIGFPGEIIHKDYQLDTIDLADMPSAIEASKIRQLLEVQEASKNSGSTTVMSRMVHTRLFGVDSPYEDRNVEELKAEIAMIEEKYATEDNHYLFEEKAQKLQLVIYNQSEEPIRDASLSLALPNHNSFYVANHLPKLLNDGKYVDRTPEENSAYPTVALSDDMVKVSYKLGEIPTDEIVNAFTAPLRICVGSSLKGRRVGIKYALYAQNLRQPVTGRLRLLF